MGAGLRPGAKATEQPPDPNSGAPVLDSTLDAQQLRFDAFGVPGSKVFDFEVWD